MTARSVVVVAVVLVASCSGPEPARQTTTVPPTTTSATITTSSTTTSTVPPLATVDVTIGGADEQLGTVISALYAWSVDRRHPVPDLPPEMEMHVAAVSAGNEDLEITGTATTADLPTGETVAVFTAGDDVVLAAREPGQAWRVAGAHLASLDIDAWYGDGPAFVLVLGSDARPGENQQRLRADSVHIATIAGNEGAIVGLPRDSWVEGPDGNTKLTSVMAGRGPEPVLDTVRGLTGLPIEGYVVTGFVGFEGLVDAFGGIEIDLPYSFRSGIEGWANFVAGLQELDGERALQLARIRKTLPRGDFDRSFHQGLIMAAALVQVQDRGIHELPDLLATLLEHTWTDLPADRLLAIAASTYELDPSAVPNVVAPGTVGSAGGASVVFLGDDAAALFEDLADGVIAATD